MSSRKDIFLNGSSGTLYVYEDPPEKTCSTAQSAKEMKRIHTFHFQEMRIYAANYF